MGSGALQTMGEASARCSLGWRGELAEVDLDDPRREGRMSCSL